MQGKIENLDSLMSEIRPYLRRYLEERNVVVDDKGWFSCVNPKHRDKNPSCGFVKETEETKFHCFSCGAHGDIFNAAFLLEDKSMEGKDFVVDNVLYLADKYGIEHDMIEMSEEELYLRRVYGAYKAAAEVVTDYQPTEFITQRKWPVSVCKDLSIGGVKSYRDFLEKMGNRGFDKPFCEDVDLNRYIFNEGMLVFTVRDEKGRAVGFSSRNMSHSKESKSMKFINTSAKCPIYKKGEILYSLDKARKHSQPLYIFEGYPDAVTAYKHGLQSVCAIGGTALTREHINTLKHMGITDCILALDGDDAGQNRIETLFDSFLSGDETIKMRIQKLPNDPEACDPDDYIDKHGLDGFKALPLFTPFQWRLDRFSYDAMPEDICDKMIPLILNDPNEVHRETMARHLSERTGIRLKTVLKQLDKMVNIDAARQDSQVQFRLKQLDSDLKFRANDPAYILETAAGDIRQILSLSGTDIHSGNEVISFLDTAKSSFEDRKPGLQGWTTGFTTLDEKLSGIPKQDTMITFAGDANVGKTGFMFSLGLGMAKNNDDILVLFHSIDDSRQQAIARLVALESGLQIRQVTHPSQHVHTEEDSRKLTEGWRAVRGLIENNRFSIKDASHGNTLDFAEGWIRWAKEEYPDREICYFLDNFHKLGDGTGKEERQRFKQASARIHSLKAKLNFTAICTMEIRKMTAGQRNQRPTLQDISESKQMEYDNNLVGMVYSDLHAKRESSKIFWTEDIDGSLTKKPIFEVDMQKNKITDFKGTLYYKFSPEYSKFYECDSMEVKEWERDAATALRHTHDKRSPSGGGNPFVSSAQLD